MIRQTRVTKGRKVGTLKASASDGKRTHDLIAEVGSLYRPIKKPITLRIDTDVLGLVQEARARLPNANQSGVAQSDIGIQKLKSCHGLVRILTDPN